MLGWINPHVVDDEPEIADRQIGDDHPDLGSKERETINIEDQLRFALQPEIAHGIVGSKERWKGREGMEKISRYLVSQRGFAGQKASDKAPCRVNEAENDEENKDIAKFFIDYVLMFSREGSVQNDENNETGD